MLLVSSSLDQQLNEGKSKFILDQVALDQLPIIFPHTFNVSSGWSYGELLHASWPKNKKNKAQRLYGVGPTAKDPPEGQIVQGDWPDLLDRLTYIPILKNGHTSLSNAFGDLRQRLNGNVELLNQSPLNTTLPPRASMNRTLLEEQRQPCTDLLEYSVTHPNFPNKLFTVLRDPIDRFISATCEEFRQNTFYRDDCLKSNWNDTMTCVIEKLPTRATPKPFEPHQDLQTKQLHEAVRGKAVGVAVISFSNLSNVMSDLGCTTHSTKVRDRKSNEYTNIIALNSFCQIHGDDLLEHQIDRLCEAYHLDVELMESVGIPVPHCAKSLKDASGRTR